MGKEQVSVQSNPGEGQPAPASPTLPLIVTKIRVPRRRHDLLPRRRLVNFIHAHLDRKLILISAPAGYGKTSLLTDFAHDTDLPVCWYTLDEFDRDLHVFLEHLIAAIARRFPAFGQRSLSFLRNTADPGSNLYPLVATMVQEIYDTIPEYFFLVLDDHHAVEVQEQINEFLDLFVTYVDENCHVIIASRTLPALPNLSLLVARRLAAGLSIDELRFTPQEIQALAEQNYKLELTIEQANKLAERTGGWITGLLLTTSHRWQQSQDEIPVRGRINIDIYDYLSRQVLDRQPENLRQFLLDSSVLDDMSPPLCAEVLQLERPDRFLDQVRIRNLFAIEFEGQQVRLRYHDLFRDFLHDTLRNENEARFRELTLRAAQAYATRGEWERAVSRYLTLGDYQPVIGIIRCHAAQFFDLGRWDTLAGWIDALPNETLVANPAFLLQRGKIHTERGEHTEALALYALAEEVAAAAGSQPGRAHALAMKGYILRFQGRYSEAQAQSEKALQLISGTSEEERFAMALAHKNIGLCHFRQGHLTKGRAALIEAARLYEALADPYGEGMAYHDLGLAHELMGDLTGAVQYYQAALQRWQELGNPGPWANTLNGLGVIYHLQGKHEQAAQTLEQALNKSRKAGDLRVEAFIWASLGDLYCDQGTYERAEQAYAQALEIASKSRIGFIQTYATNGMGNISRLRGDKVRAISQLDRALALADQHGSAYEASLCHVALGVLAGETGDLDEALRHLNKAIERFDAGGFRRDLASACLQRAQIAFKAGKRQQALSDLAQTLELARELGFDQFIVVEGQRLAGLLEYARSEGLDEDTISSLQQRLQTHQATVEARPEPSVQVEPGQALRIYALGQPRVTLDGESIQWAIQQSRDLFFCLLQHASGLRKEEIGALFWPDHPPHKLDGIFRSTLYRLRRAVFRESVIFADSQYRFNWDSDYWYDVQAFEELLDEAADAALADEKLKLLEEALTLCKGDYLAGVYDDWSVIERERLRELHLSARESLARLYASRGSLQSAVETYQHLVTLDPYREPAHRELMRCHYRLGDRVAAIKQYQSCVQILRDDLGLSPTSETEELYLQIID
jgi:LuxR family maltose regulon positive regulatory protein